jgi:hypothetical protein
MIGCVAANLYRGIVIATWSARFCESYEFGSACVFAGATLARSALRRQVFYRRDWQWGLLPFDLSSSYGKRKEHPVFSECVCGRGSRLSALSAMPAGEFAGNSGMAGNFSDGFAGFAPDWGERTGGRRCRGSCETTGSWSTASSTVVFAASGSNADSGGADATSALREEVDRRDEPADESD